MGFKRTFDAEDAQEHNVKHARQISYCNKLAKLDEGVPFRVSLEKSGVIGEDLSDLYGFKCEGNVEKGFETNGEPFSWTTTGFEEDAESGATTQSTLSQESDFLWKPCPADDVYWCRSPPVKPVPIGSDHQADIPECVKDQVPEQDEDQVMGKCVIPMPDCETEVGKGRKECVCMDKGSIRCVQQHIMESREDLYESIGYETCLKLGLGEMGEEVAGKLSEDEEDRFHEIVYSNPVSMDLDFWEQLKHAFPSRTMKEIVSYYFNVFVLRRRAVQNRSKSLDIDSDDDEWQVDYDNNNFYGAETSDGKTGKSLSRDEEEEEEEEEEEVMNVDETSCMSYDFQSNVVYSRCPVRNREESNAGNYWRHCNDDLVEDDSYRFDPCDSILPDHCWSKNIDLLPTSNIIDEIFGEQDPSSWDDFSRGK
uniref:AT-rich interactive domain-containing protein 2 n=1 Tax=Noccaea caerulescens TaxID=107243 RepID=A0A1J3G3Z1_NOCCA